MAAAAAVILAHTDAVQVRRLISALEDVRVFLHCDAGADPQTLFALTANLPGRVTLLPRMRTTLASWSLVEAELAGIRQYLAHTRAEYVVVMSGADYPLISMQRLDHELSGLNGGSWIWNRPLPHREWNTSQYHDGGRWRMDHRFVTHRGQIVWLSRIPLRWPWRRAIPPELELRASTQWKILGREDAIRIVDLADHRSDLVRFWSTTLVPEESFVASMLASRSLVGSDALKPCSDHAWYMDWNNTFEGHPRWLSDVDYSALRAARRPAAALDPGGGPGQVRPRLFARKFRSTSPRVLDRIDEIVAAERSDWLSDGG